ncbi:hypothetical protein EVI01_04210 [Enterococcus villorum]|uniref:Uncharacterized protein n=2 Tax=Enterococcus villorum TaxID=112904 RepID=A0A511IZB6_9ENTE|nr:hypothetical protein UAO_02082 [Enterococcus villorum ATCC 700913]EOW77910.1 hypothetical protein I591_00764 [Enterococcus villorum ATCC 700913]GEL91084.1 hypothetical protein EVI01_04210 [Enterococcus villorum]
MLFLVCLLTVWLNLVNYINISWWILIPSLLGTALFALLELFLIYKEIKDIQGEQKITHQPFWKHLI